MCLRYLAAFKRFYANRLVCKDWYSVDPLACRRLPERIKLLTIALIFLFSFPLVSPTSIVVMAFSSMTDPGHYEDSGNAETNDGIPNGGVRRYHDGHGRQEDTE